MFEATSFRDWFYGTSNDSLNSSAVNIGVFNPDGIDALLESPEVQLMVVYVHASDKTRLLRQLHREANPDVDEIVRRFKTDREDFSDLEFSYFEVANETREDLQAAVSFVSKMAEVFGHFGQK